MFLFEFILISLFIIWDFIKFNDFVNELLMFEMSLSVKGTFDNLFIIDNSLSLFGFKFFVIILGKLCEFLLMFFECSVWFWMNGNSSSFNEFLFWSDEIVNVDLFVFDSFVSVWVAYS